MIQEDSFCQAVIMNNGKVRVGRDDLPIKWIKIDASGAGDTPVVAAVTGKKIRVITIDFCCAGAVTVAWKSGSTAIRGAQAFAANGGVAYNAHPGWYAETAAGEALVINLDAAVSVQGSISYVEV